MNNYQNIAVNGREYGKPNRKHSAFFNEGKWKNFIEPFLPDDCSDMTFLDFGCNYGLYLKLARERGFKQVLGIESNEGMRDITTEYLGCSDQVIYTKLDEAIFTNTVIANLPAADFVLMANFHYHLWTSVLLHLVNLLRHKTRYAIVVDLENPEYHKVWKAENGIESVRRYFRAWKETKYIGSISPDGDPAPRDGMYGVMFKTDVERIQISEIPWGGYSRRFYAKVKKGSAGYVDKAGRTPHSPMSHPILLRQTGGMVDGFHRLARHELAGETTVLAEKV